MTLTHARTGPAPVQSESSPRAAALAEDLRAAVRGEVRFDRGSRALYATDGSNYRQPPIGVVIPRAMKPDCVSKSNVRQTMWRGMALSLCSLAYNTGAGAA